MHTAGLEDGDVDLAVFAPDLQLIVGFHVFGGDAIFMDDGAGDALADALLVGILDRVAGDVIEDLAVFNAAFGRLLRFCQFGTDFTIFLFGGFLSQG